MYLVGDEVLYRGESGYVVADINDKDPDNLSYTIVRQHVIASDIEMVNNEPLAWVMSDAYTVEHEDLQYVGEQL